MQQPGRDCELCPRLCAFRAENRRQFPDWHNAPVPSFGSADARILIVGLAPGLRGANRTGRPFTGDHAGELLFATLKALGLAEGEYRRSLDDGLRLVDCRITNAVRCVPPANRPTPAEVRTCGAFLQEEIASLPRLQVLVALGSIAHDAVTAAVGARHPRRAFAHGAWHDVSAHQVGSTPAPHGARRLLLDSYHCSRQNTNTGRLTPSMFESVLAAARTAVVEGEGTEASFTRS